jgi:hypothetical protein|tara:strand:- start:1066 stop:1779 length:714 start_codon:yes stop_codon:yes gene_type:complete
MYVLKNYMLSMQSHWMINQNTYQAVQDSLPTITRYMAQRGMDKMERTPIHKMVKNPFPDVYTIPIFRRSWCKMMCQEIDHMKKEFGFESNSSEDDMRQIPEIILKERCPELYTNMWFVVRNVIDPIIMSLWQRSCPDPASIQIANYNLAETEMGHWHHDESSDISVVVPLNTGSYTGGGTEFHNFGKLKPLPNGHGLIFPSFTHNHRGLPVSKGDRYLLVFWLYNKSRVVDLIQANP